MALTDHWNRRLRPIRTIIIRGYMNMTFVKRLMLALVVSGVAASVADAGGDPGNSLAAARGGARGGGLQIATTGLFVIDSPVTGEPSIAGMVLAAFSGGGGTPADTVVTLNGVALAHWSVNPSYFVVSPTGPQPALGADGILHLFASSASTSTSRALDLACPAPIAVTANPVAGASLAGSSVLTLAWPALPQNVPAVMNFFLAPSAALYAYDAANNAIAGGSGFQQLNQASTTAILTVAPTTATGYLAELRYPGLYLLDGNTGGVCGRAERFTFTN
jgi:hypothetical protein